MAITIGNKTQSNQNPNGNSQTLAHNNNGDSVLVVITMANSTDFSGCTYNGTAMDLIQNVNYSGQSQRCAAYYLENADSGSNNIVVNFTGSQFNSTSIFAVSFSGAGAYGAFGSNGALTTPNSQSITVSEGSVVYLTGLSSNAQNSQYSIAGSNRAFEFSHNTNKIVRGALSAVGLTAGATNVTTNADFGTITNFRVEITESGGGGGGRRRIIVV